MQGGFAHRTFSPAERWALRLGRLVPGTAARLPLRRQILAYNSRLEFPSLLDDRWDYYLEQNGLTPIRSLAHRVDLLTGLDLRPILPAIPTEILLLQGNEDRIVPRRDFEVLKAALPKAEAVDPADGRPSAAHDARRGPGATDPPVAPALRRGPGRLHRTGPAATSSRDSRVRGEIARSRGRQPPGFMRRRDRARLSP